MDNSWKAWFLKYIEPLFENDTDVYFDFLSKKCVPFFPNEEAAKKFYNEIEGDIRFDIELKYFFSFLYSCGFFINNNISFEEWLKMGNWFNPQSNICGESIIELIETTNGVELLKEKLRWLPFLDRREGY